jgi:sarcosine oxidase subunit beta
VGLTSARERFVIIGAGATGLSVALNLAADGHAPLVLDRSGIGAGASGVQPGGLRQQWSTAATCRLARESLAAYRELAGQTLASYRFDACGYVFVAHTVERLEALRRGVEVQREAGVPSRLLTPSELEERVPGLVVEGLAGAAVCEEDGYFDRPQAVVEALGEHARTLGARIERRTVRGIGRDGEGFRLELEDRSLSAERVVLAAGADSAGLAAGLEVELPIEAEARHIFLSRPVGERLLEPLVVSGERRFAAKQLADGRIMASDLSASGDVDAGRDRWRSRVARVVEELLPRLSHAALPLLLSGDYDVTPDHQPIVGELPGAPGAFVAAGFSGHGFMLAPAIGRRVAALASGRKLDGMMNVYAPTRFAAGRGLDAAGAELQTV